MKNSMRKTSIGPDLFDTPVREKRIREGVMAYQYRNGVINIEGQKYLMCSMTEAIAEYRRNYPAKVK